MFLLNDKIKDLKPYDPEMGDTPIHLDANESFLPLPAPILEELAAAVPQVACNRYPDPAAQELCQAFAQYYGVPVENVAAGNGSDELITVLFTGFLQKGEAFATLEPDFSMYAFNGYLQEARHVPIPKGEDYAIDVDRTIQTCRQEGVKLLIFSTPGNPTSIVCPRQEVRRLIQGLPDTLVVLDEAYMDFSDQSLLPEFHDYDNLLLLRTCSKAFGMAGLRLGFAVEWHDRTHELALENAVAGITDKMVAFERETVDGHYVCKTKLLPLTSVANFEKKIPLEWINDSHNGVKQEFIDYVLPLIQGEPKLPKEDSLPRFAKLKKVLAK